MISSAIWSKSSRLKLINVLTVDNGRKNRKLNHGGMKFKISWIWHQIYEFTWSDINCNANEYFKDLTTTATTLEMFSSVCRVCLQDGELFSLYEKAEGADLSYSEKIMQVTYINLVRYACYQLLNVAPKFQLLIFLGKKTPEPSWAHLYILHNRPWRKLSI